MKCTEDGSCMNFGGGSDFLSSIFFKEAFNFNFIFGRRVGQQDVKRKNKESREEKGEGRTVETQDKIAGRVMLKGRKHCNTGNVWQPLMTLWFTDASLVKKKKKI